MPGGLQINRSVNPQTLSDHLDFRGKGRRLKLFKDLPKKTELTTENKSSKEGPAHAKTPLWWVQFPASKMRIKNPVCRTDPSVVLSRE